MLRGIWIFLDRDGEIFHELFFFFFCHHRTMLQGDEYIELIM